MNRVLKYLGVLFLSLLAVGLVYGGLSYYKFQEYSEEVEGLVPSFLKDIPSRQQYLVLGEYLSCPETKHNHLEIEFNKTIKATLDLTCDFANGEAEILMSMIRVNKEWELDKVRVTSDLFNSAFNQAKQWTL
jgi:hypothetical protein